MQKHQFNPLDNFTGGIAQVAPENISQYFNPCFDEAYNTVKEDSRKNAEVLFGATAGMRLLKYVEIMK